MPGSIISAEWFSLQDKAVPVGGAKLGRAGVPNRTIKWYQIKEALLDPQLWLLALYMLLNGIINGGIANFGKLNIKGLVTRPSSHDCPRYSARSFPSILDFDRHILSIALPKYPYHCHDISTTDCCRCHSNVENGSRNPTREDRRPIRVSRWRCFRTLSFLAFSPNLCRYLGMYLAN